MAEIQPHRARLAGRSELSAPTAGRYFSVYERPGPSNAPGIRCIIASGGSHSRFGAVHTRCDAALHAGQGGGLEPTGMNSSKCCLHLSQAYS